MLTSEQTSAMKRAPGPAGRRKEQRLVGDGALRQRPNHSCRCLQIGCSNLEGAPVFKPYFEPLRWGVKLRLDLAVADDCDGKHEQCGTNNPQLESPTSPIHCWLTNRINIPTAINRASRIPTTNDITGWRLGLTSFDLAPFCAAPMPNQKRSLSIERYLAQNRRCFLPEFGTMLSETLAKLNRRAAQ